MYLDVLDGHDGAGEGHVRVDLDNDRVHSVWENVLEVLRGENKRENVWDSARGKKNNGVEVLRSRTRLLRSYR